MRSGRRLRVLLWILAFVLALGFLPWRDETLRCGDYRSRVTTRLLDAETRAPVAGASVAAFGEDSWDLSGSGTSGSDGVVAIDACASFGHRELRICGLLVEESGAPHPGYGAKTLRIEKPGYRPQTVEVPRGRWAEVESRDPFDPRALADLGDILLVRE
jgi:hypothetical protein